jgi:hypothetical protein
MTSSVIGGGRSSGHHNVHWSSQCPLVITKEAGPAAPGGESKPALARARGAVHEELLPQAQPARVRVVKLRRRDVHPEAAHVPDLERHKSVMTKLRPEARVRRSSESLRPRLAGKHTYQKYRRVGLI